MGNSFYGDYAGVFLFGSSIQIGLLKGWRMDEKTLAVPVMHGQMKRFKLIGWSARAKAYKFKSNPIGKKLEFRFCGKFNYRKCSGNITSDNIVVGETVNDIITMDGNTPPLILWR